MRGSKHEAELFKLHRYTHTKQHFPKGSLNIYQTATNFTKMKFLKETENENKLNCRHHEMFQNNFRGESLGGKVSKPNEKNVGIRKGC